MKKAFFVFIICTAFVNLKAQTNIEGNWEGNIYVFGNQIGMLVHFTNVAGDFTGTIDIPSQGANGLKLSNIMVGKSFPESILFQLEIPNATAIFDGYYYMDDSLSGKFSQSGYEGTFLLTRATLKQEEKKEPKPYKEEEIIFHNGDNTFAGTLTLPELAGKHPAAILITGSGAHDRNEEIMGFKIFEIIADYLTRNGIAVLRYDDRNVGGSKGTPKMESTSEELSGDVIEAAKYLRTRNDINHQQIGLIGHSEGGMIAPMASVKLNNDLAFLVLIAGPSVKGSEIILEQTKLISQAEGKYDESDREIQSLIDAANGLIPMDSVKAILRKDIEKQYDEMTDEMKSKVPERETYIGSNLNIILSSFDNKWMKYFLTYDPKSMIEKVTIPVLALYGGKDLQVSASQNVGPMRDGLTKAGNKLFEIKIFEDANHLFQSAGNGSPSEYGKLKKEFTPGFLEYIKTWILRYVSPVR